MTKRGPSSSPFSKSPARLERLPEERLCEGVRLAGGLVGGVFAAVAARAAAEADLAGLLEGEEGGLPMMVP